MTLGLGLPPPQPFTIILLTVEVRLTLTDWILSNNREPPTQYPQCSVDRVRGRNL